MPTYKRSEDIEQSIRSLLDGTFTDFELLVRDDGDGTDGTEEVVERIASEDPRVRYHRNSKNCGMPKNLNLGLEDARAELVAVCHDHDIYKPDFLALMVETLLRHPSALFVHSAIEVVNHQDQILSTHVGHWDELVSGNECLRFMLQSMNCPICALTVVRRSAHEEFGVYASKYGFISDYELWMRLSTQGDVAYVNSPVIQVRAREAGHPAEIQSVHWMRIAARIHREYLPKMYSGLPLLWRRLRVEYTLARFVVRNQVSTIGRAVLRYAGKPRSRQ